MKNEKNATPLNTEKLRRVVSQARRRLYLRSLLESASSSFLFATCAAVVYVAASVAFGKLAYGPGVIVGITFAIGCAATLASFFTARFERHEAEKAIDRRYSFDDRFLTASELIKRAETGGVNDFERLQLLDCLERVDQVEPGQVVSIKPRGGRARLALLAAAVAALAFVLWKPNADQALAKTPNETSLSVSRELHDNLLAPVRELADADPENAELRALSTRLQELVDEFDANNDDPKKGTSIIAQMEQEIKNTIAACGVEKTEKSLKDLGEAFGAIESTRTLSTALAEGDYGTAADELEKLDFEKMSVRDRQALADRLKAAAEILRSRKDEQTAQLTEQLADELQSGKCASCKDAACKMAGKLRKHLTNKETEKQLNCQLARLGLCKSNCAGACSTCTANCPSNAQQPGGAGQKDSSAQTANGAKAEGDGKRPTSSTGLASDPLSGSDSQMATEKTLTRVSGKEGDEGASSVETVASGSGQAAELRRERDEKEREYVKQIEAALDADSVPIERRRVVRSYFEEIRKSDEPEVNGGEN